MYSFYVIVTSRLSRDETRIQTLIRSHFDHDSSLFSVKQTPSLRGITTEESAVLETFYQKLPQSASCMCRRTRTHAAGLTQQRWRRQQRQHPSVLNHTALLQILSSEEKAALSSASRSTGTETRQKSSFGFILIRDGVTRINNLQHHPCIPSVHLPVLFLSSAEGQMPFFGVLNIFSRWRTQTLNLKLRFRESNRCQEIKKKHTLFL